MTHSYVWHDSFVCVTWRTLMCDMTHLCVWHDALLCVTWLICVCDMTLHMCAMTNSHTWDMTHSYVHICASRHAHEGVTPEAQQHWHAADYAKWESLALWRTWPSLEHLLTRSWKEKKACQQAWFFSSRWTQRSWHILYHTTRENNFSQLIQDIHTRFHQNKNKRQKRIPSSHFIWVSPTAPLKATNRFCSPVNLAGELTFPVFCLFDMLS